MAVGVMEGMVGTRGLARLPLMVVGCASFRLSGTPLMLRSQLKCGNARGRCQGIAGFVVIPIPPD